MSRRHGPEDDAPDHTIGVLMVDDDEDDYLITSDLLANQPRARFAVDWEPEFDRAMAAIREQRHDVYLIDYRLGSRTGLDLVREAFAARPMAPVIMLTGHADYEIDLAASESGVTDYLVKQDLTPSGLERSIRYAINHHRTVALSRSEERYALAIQAANDGIWDWDLINDQVYFSQRWHALLGQPEVAREAGPDTWFSLVHPDDLPGLREAIAAHLEGRSPHLQFDHRMRHADGDWRWVMVRGLATRDPGDQPTRMAGSLSDITERRAAQLQLEHDAVHDTLTGLPNRTLFLDRVDHALKRSTRDGSPGCAVLFFDVDRFKLINDNLSHSAGDELLIELASRVRETLRPGDTVARLGGDEFTVLLESVTDPDEAQAAAERILRSVQRPFALAETSLDISVSIGIALSAPGLRPGELMRQADIAMYDAKRHGRARSAMFDEGMRQQVVNRLARETSLRHVVETSLMEIHYQPVVDLASGRIVSLEALARWPGQWPSVAPAEFIAIAEETGLVGALGDQIMRTALGQLSQWRREALVSDDVSVSVNLSGRQLDEAGLAGRVLAAIDDAGLPAQALRLEINESTLVHAIERAQPVFTQLGNSGVGLYVDDFGTGYSSLTALHRVPFDGLKLERSVVAALSDPAEGDAIVRTAVAAARSLGMAVIAEGVENENQLRRLRSLGCAFGQGYLFTRALSPHDMIALLGRWNAREVSRSAAPRR